MLPVFGITYGKTAVGIGYSLLIAAIDITLIDTVCPLLLNAKPMSISIVGRDTTATEREREATERRELSS
jgi:hypothetical protein